MARKTGRQATNSVSIKGTKEGLVVTIGEGTWSDVVADLTEHIQRKPAFFDGACAILRTGLRELGPDELREIQELLSANNMELRGIRTGLASTVAAAGTVQIPAEIQTEEVETDHGRTERDLDGENAVLVRRTIRSGQSVTHSGHVTIVGDVNPGAQVLAGGNVVVWGKLRGTVHAGAMGDDRALVCALELAPTQLRIGNHIARSPDGEPGVQGIPEVALVQENGIVVEPWSIARS
jgi:septum site-determining protein MinC